MKKIILLLLSIFIMSGCVKKEDKKENIIESNSLVLYFSATGNTENVAKKICELSNFPLMEIVPKVKYTNADLNYNNENSRANKEQRDNTSRPAIANDIDISKYDTIYLGYPIWWGTVPRIIYTLLDNYNFEDKIIIPFCTSGGSGIEESIKDLKSYNSNLTILDGKRFADTNEKEILNFLSKYVKEKN